MECSRGSLNDTEQTQHNTRADQSILQGLVLQFGWYRIPIFSLTGTE